MKPGKPLERRTELQRKTPLRSTSPVQREPMIPLHREADPALPKNGRSRMRPISAKRAREGVQRTRVQQAMRAGASWCARCGRTGVDLFGHERLARSQGGNWLEPDCLLCNDCNGWCEDNPQVAAWTGWKISSKWPQDPALEIGQAWDLRGVRVVFAELAERAS